MVEWSSAPPTFLVLRLLCLPRTALGNPEVVLFAVLAVLGAFVVSSNAWAATVGIGPDGKILFDGSPFFPFGFFANVGDPRRDLDAVGLSGFNTVQCNNECNEAYYARAQELGVKVIQEIWWKDARSSVLGVRDQRPLLAWSVADDLNIRGNCATPRYTPAQVAARSKEIKLYDREPPFGRLTTGALVLSSECKVTPYAGAVDILQGFNYPVENWGNPGDWLERNVEAVRQLVEAGGGTRAVIIDNQTFAWPGKRLPTPAEIRNMNYASIVQGVSGILMYALSDANGYYLPKASPAMWEELKTEAREITALAPLLLEGHRTALASGQIHVHAASWTDGVRTLVIVVSTDRAVTRQVNLPLGDGSNRMGPLGPAFLAGPATIGVEDGALAGTIAPESVIVLMTTPRQRGESDGGL